MELVGITGGSGFIGTHLRKYFDEKGISYKCFEGNLLNEDEIEEYFEKNRIKQIVHLVGTFDLPFENLIEKNLFTTQKLLEVGCRKGLEKIIYASTGAVYGDPLEEESQESDMLRPDTLYGLAKIYSEECIKYYFNSCNLQYVILRFPNVYGDGNRKGVIYNFLSDIKNKGKITIAGDGTQSRNFLHVTDACRAIIKSLSYSQSEIFNISNPVNITINEVVEILSKKYKFTTEYKPLDNKLTKLQLNINKAREKLNFYPKVTELRI